MASGYKGIAQVASITLYQTSHSHAMEHFHHQCHYLLLLHFSILLFALHLLMADFKNIIESIMILCPQKLNKIKELGKIKSL